jgi:ATP-binding cassette subfamily B protein
MLPESRRLEVESWLHSGESVLAWFAPDLDDRLRFARGLVVLTDRRLLSLPAEGEVAGSNQLRQWRLDEIAELTTRDRAGLGTLEVIGPTGPLAHWRYTVAVASGANGLVEHLERFRLGERSDDEGWGDAEDQEAVEETVEHRPGSGWALFRLGYFALQRGRLVALGFVLTLLTTVAGLIPTYLTWPLIDDVLIPYQHEVDTMRAAPPERQAALAAALARGADARYHTVVWYLSLLAGAALLAWGLSWAQGIVLAWVSERIGADLRIRTYAHLQHSSLEFFSKKRTGDLISRISTDTERICTFLADNVVDFGSDLLIIIGTALVLAWIDFWLALVTLIPLPLVAWVIYRARDQLQHGFHRGGRAWAGMANLLADTIPGIRVVKAFAQEQREVERFRAANDRVLEANDRVNTVWTFFWPLVVLLNQLGLVVVWAYGAWRVLELQITVGVLTTFLAYIRSVYLRLESMSRMISHTERAGASAQRIFEILDRAPRTPEPKRPVPCERVRGEVELRSVSFRYGSRPILQDVNLHIQPGEMIGLVGPSGAGKSTLVNLVCRFYDVTDGAVLVDGVDVRSYGVADYRRHIGIVLQEPFLFYGTIAENIAYGKPGASRDQIMAAARAARAHDFILRLPLGYDSLVGERGQTLSGGERQRISIARALLIDPRILILDEATSSVDVETEREIQAALDNLVRGRTTIAIAHRLSTLRKADRLVVLERGRIVEVGKHPELVEAGGVYARLHQAQLELTQGLAVE